MLRLRPAAYLAADQWPDDPVNQHLVLARAELVGMLVGPLACDPTEWLSGFGSAASAAMVDISGLQEGRLTPTAEMVVLKLSWGLATTISAVPS